MEVRSSDTDELIQTIKLAFPDGEFRRPGVAPNLIKGGWVDGVWVGDTVGKIASLLDNTIYLTSLK